MNIYRLLLRLYPDAWRTRYEEEFLVVLAAHPFSVAEGIDVIRGAFDAYLHPYLGVSPLSEKLSRTCSGELYAFVTSTFEEIDQNYLDLAAHLRGRHRCQCYYA
ncbi:hypothetical protein [Dictyobacter arantiisoli]|uniref:hypothetical protein n=1 Tax=Dictyobacter arantiisoli TaxID=2014874 RepID=UPI0011EF9314|nr:hypothetical protein [Dictyobacter arantiisoli]